MSNKLRQIIRDEIAKGSYDDLVIQDAEQRVGSDFIATMRDYLERQDSDPNFNSRTELYDLYDDLCFIYEHYEKSQDID